MFGNELVIFFTTGTEKSARKSYANPEDRSHLKKVSLDTEAEIVGSVYISQGVILRFDKALVFKRL